MGKKETVYINSYAVGEEIYINKKDLIIWFLKLKDIYKEPEMPTLIDGMVERLERIVKA